MMDLEWTPETDPPPPYPEEDDFQCPYLMWSIAQIVTPVKFCCFLSKVHKSLVEIPHIYKICFISQSGYLLFRSCPVFFRGSYHKIMHSLAKHFENREANIRYDPFSLCPTSFLQPSWVMEPPRIFFLYMSASAGFKRYLIFKTSTYVVNILSNVPAPADLYIWALSAWTCPAQVRRCCFKKSWGVTQPKRRKPVCPACPVWRAPTERFCCVQQIFHSRQYHFLCGYIHWASTCKCRKRRLG